MPPDQSPESALFMEDSASASLTLSEDAVTSVPSEPTDSDLPDAPSAIAMLSDLSETTVTSSLDSVSAERRASTEDSVISASLDSGASRSAELASVTTTRTSVTRRLELVSSAETSPLDTTVIDARTVIMEIRDSESASRVSRVLALEDRRVATSMLTLAIFEIPETTHRISFVTASKSAQIRNWLTVPFSDPATKENVAESALRITGDPRERSVELVNDATAMGTLTCQWKEVAMRRRESVSSVCITRKELNVSTVSTGTMEMRR